MGIANMITSARIFCSVFLLFTTPLSSWFYILYSICGFTDMIDGTVARKTNTANEFGAKLDTVADFIFIVVGFIKLLPVLDIEIWLWIWIAAIAVIKITNLISSWICYKRLLIEHTIVNKVTGALMFLLPYTFAFVPLKYSAIVVCSIATFAAVQEGHFIKTGREVV